MRKALLFAASVAFALGALLAACAAQAKPVVETARTGAYAVTLKVLPAESFSGAHAAMAWDSGAKPVMLDAASKPNHHLVVFVKKDGKPVEDATVTIRYRMADAKGATWTSVPVARMHVAGKGPATTHYGNNVTIAPGTYMALVTVDGSAPAQFRFTLRPKWKKK